MFRLRTSTSRRGSPALPVTALRPGQAGTGRTGPLRAGRSSGGAGRGAARTLLDQERMTQEHVPGLACRHRGGAVSTSLGCHLAGSCCLEPGVTGRCEERRHIQVRARAHPGRRAVRIDIGQQVQGEQPAGPRGEVDSPVPLRLEAGFKMPTRVSRVFLARKPHRDRPAHAVPPPPAPSADQLIASLAHRRCGTSLRERPSFWARNPDHGCVPRRSVIPGDAALAKLGPDDLLAGRGDAG